jgi:hypothetical protein
LILAIDCVIYLFAFYLMMLSNNSVSAVSDYWITANNELEGIWKEVALTLP